MNSSSSNHRIQERRGSGAKDVARARPGRPPSSTRTSKSSNPLREKSASRSGEDKSPKIPKKLERVLEYNQEFEAIIRSELQTLLGAKTTQQKGCRGVGKNSITFCSTVVDKSGGEVMENILETTFVTSPGQLTIMDPAFDFRNNARVQVQKFKVDLAFQTRESEIFRSNIVKPLVEQTCLGVLSTLISVGKKSRDQMNFLEHSIQHIVQELLLCAGATWKLSLSCLEIFGSKVCDLLDMNQVVRTAESPMKTGSVYGLSSGRSTFTEVALETSEQCSHLFSRVLKLRKSSNRAHFLCKIRLKHKSGQVEDGWLNIVDLAAIDEDTDNLIRKSHMVLKECVQGRLKASEAPHQNIIIPYKASKLTQLLREVFKAGAGRQVNFLCLASFGPTLLDLQDNLDLMKYLVSLKGPKKKESSSSIEVNNEVSPVEWGPTPTKQWFQLNSDIPETRIPELPCAHVLRLTQIEYLKLMKGASPSTPTNSLLQTLDLLWHEIETLKLKDRNKTASKSKKAFQKKSGWRLEDDIEAEDLINDALGATRRQYEAKLNAGFERNVPRFVRRTDEMMKLEWAGKVKAADRAEAKLYPVLSIDTKQFQSKSRRNSIYE